MLTCIISSLAFSNLLVSSEHLAATSMLVAGNVWGGEHEQQEKGEGQTYLQLIQV